jgi:hypothetical protein
MNSKDYIAVKYVGVVDGHLGVLSKKVKMKN